MPPLNPWMSLSSAPLKSEVDRHAERVPSGLTCAFWAFGLWHKHRRMKARKNACVRMRLSSGSANASIGSMPTAWGHPESTHLRRQHGSTARGVFEPRQALKFRSRWARPQDDQIARAVLQEPGTRYGQVSIKSARGGTEPRFVSRGWGGSESGIGAWSMVDGRECLKTLAINKQKGKHRVGSELGQHLAFMTTKFGNSQPWRARSKLWMTRRRSRGWHM